jgi:hypothetical protein
MDIPRVYSIRCGIVNGQAENRSYNTVTALQLWVLESIVDRRHSRRMIPHSMLKQRFRHGQPKPNANRGKAQSFSKLERGSSGFQIILADLDRTPQDLRL